MKRYFVLCFQYWYSLTALSVLILTIHFSATAQPDLELPIEVFRLRNIADTEWQNSTTRKIATRSYNGSAGWLYLQVNNLNRAGAMQYRVRVYQELVAQPWTDWQNCTPSFAAFPRDQAYGGLGGGFGTTRFTTPITGLQPNQQHDIEFRYLPEAGEEASGYRILALELWTANNVNSADQIANPRAKTNPNDWQGPFAGTAVRPQQANAGRDLWLGAVALQDANGQPIKSSCSSCHAQSGYDLKYFNYSDESIIARANFHGLSREQGEQIAQYIRDLPNAASQNGRPWQPPYQPGPNADANAYEWAAGQGLESVAVDDNVLLADMFGSTNPSTQQIQAAINNFRGNTNLRTQRIAVQFPDWNEWLPVEHPEDILGAADYNRLENAFTNLKSSVDSPAKVNALNNKNGVNPTYAGNGLFEAVDQFVREVNRVVSGNYNLTYPNSPSWADNISNQAVERKKRSLSSWMSVKLFDVIQEYQLHDIDDLKNIPNTDEETFQWPSRQWAVFQNAAHIISGNRVTSYFLTDNTPTKQTKSVYLSSLWYQVQLTLTPGNRRGGMVEPNDYSYNLQHIHKLGVRSGIYEPARFFQNYQKAAEQRNNGVTPKASLSQSYAGWNMRELSPWRLWSTGKGNAALFNALPADLRQRLREGYWNGALSVMESFADTDWPRTALDVCARTDFHLENRGVVPQNGATNGGNCIFYDRRCYNDCEDANDAVEIDAVYTLLYLTKDGSQINETTFNRLRTWADARWDYTQWPVYEGNTDPDPDPTPPSAPQNLAASLDGGVVSLAWKENPETDLAGYRVYRATTSGGPYTLLTTNLVTEENYTDNTVSPNPTYYYVVRAVNNADLASAYSVEASITVPNANQPPSVTITSPTDGDNFTTEQIITLAAQVTDADENLEEVVFLQDGAAINQTPTQTGNQFTLQLDQLSPGTYTFQARATDLEGAESLSAQVTISLQDTPPLAPTGLSASLNGASVALAWDENTEADLKGYHIYRSTTAGSGYVRLNTNLLTEAKFTDNNVTPGTTYYYIVQAVDGADQASAYSEEESTIVPNANQPPDVTITSPNDGANFVQGQTITITAQATDADNNLEELVFLQDGAVINQTPTQTGNQFRINLNNLPSGVYSFAARATDLSEESTISEKVTITVQNNPTIPSAPVNLLATLSSNTVQLTWDANQEADIKGYDIYRSITPGGAYTKLNTNLITESDFADTDTPAGTTYYYVVQAVDNADRKSAYSEEVNATVPTTNQLPSVTITSPTLEQKFSEGQAIGLVARASDGDGSVIKVVFYRDDILLAQPITQQDDEYRTTMESLLAGSYAVRVEVTDDQGARVSATITITVDALAPVPPAAPQNLLASLDGTSVALVWDENKEADLKGYHLYRATTSDGPYTLLTTNLLTQASYSDNNVSAGTSYFYTVRAFNQADQSSQASNQANLTIPTPPVEPPRVTLVAPLDSAVIRLGDSVRVEALVTDAENRIERLVFTANGLTVATLEQAPYAFFWHPRQAGNYILQVYAVGENGVADTVLVQVNEPLAGEEELPMPPLTDPEPTEPSTLVSNMLTPNGDYRNDTWRVGKGQDCRVWVYDRGGRLVFEQRHYQSDWAGTSQGSALGPGVYYYRVQWADTQLSVTGFLTIIHE